MSFVLQPGEFFEPTANTIWRLLSRSEPCSEVGCWHAAIYELDRTVIPGTVSALDFRCSAHVPFLITGTGQNIHLPLATGGPISAPVPKFDGRNMGIPSIGASFECPECWNTGYYHGFGVPCKLGCKPGKPVYSHSRRLIVLL